MYIEPILTNEMLTQGLRPLFDIFVYGSAILTLGSIIIGGIMFAFSRAIMFCSTSCGSSEKEARKIANWWKNAVDLISNLLGLHNDMHKK